MTLCRLREMQEKDWNFVRDSWLKSYRGHATTSTMWPDKCVKYVYVTDKGRELPCVRMSEKKFYHLAMSMQPPKVGYILLVWYPNVVRCTECKRYYRRVPPYIRVQTSYWHHKPFGSS